MQISAPKITLGSIEFNDFETIKASADILAAHIQKVEVTEDNVKESRALLSAVNKEVKELESQRIQIKKEMLKPYQLFERQVKEIVKVVKEADEAVRMQVRALEEEARDAKYNAIEELFMKRIQIYHFVHLFTARDFIQPEFLNKSYSMNKVETALVNWFTKIEDDLTAIDTMEHSAEILAEYQDTKSLAISVKLVQDRYERLEKNKAMTYNEQKKCALSRNI
ncbi:DUF1351 domain-containing protein [Listeria fleischmannii]|uniref:DUF1351 domain-containing protein n=1 Tax=Listeria fleischmannii FSL S10-1203 TaxID=1265822 RepID=W7DQ21_9LIST|nr:DUF1351 domain-containing protein [Listeria fleischmannii]EUJ59178.1 hypothetical protein MCOL2_05885 [Listeria fleischmannii FSL S10-1203]